MKSPLEHVRWVLGYEGIPRMARPSFRCDFLSNLFAALGAGALMPAVTGQFARRGLGASTWAIALLIALMPLGNFFGTFFAQRMGHFRRVPLVVGSRIGMALFLASIALLPGHEVAAGSFVALLLVPCVLLAVVLNAQNSVRHSNYPDNARGRIFSRLTITYMAAMATSTKLAGYALDYLTWSHRLIYVVAACMMLLSAAFYSRMRVRGERALLRNHVPAPGGLLAGFRLLREDRYYGQFMLWQMLSGSAQFMVWPVFTLIMTDYLKVPYGQGVNALSVVPLLVVMCTVTLAGKLFDHIRITRFRGIAASMWIVSRVIIFLAVVEGFWPAVLVGFAVQGLGWSMGNLAYNLGHTHFTTPNRSQEYMGIHLTLMGIRGLIMPMVGIMLLNYVGLSVLLIAAGIHAVAAIGFFTMRPPADGSR